MILGSFFLISSTKIKLISIQYHLNFCSIVTTATEALNVFTVNVRIFTGVTTHSHISLSMLRVTSSLSLCLSVYLQYKRHSNMHTCRRLVFVSLKVLKPMTHSIAFAHSALILSSFRTYTQKPVKMAPKSYSIYQA